MHFKPSRKTPDFGFLPFPSKPVRLKNPYFNHCAVCVVAPAYLHTNYVSKTVIKHFHHQHSYFSAYVLDMSTDYIPHCAAVQGMYAPWIVLTLSVRL